MRGKEGLRECQKQYYFAQISRDSLITYRREICDGELFDFC